MQERTTYDETDMSRNHVMRNFVLGAAVGAGLALLLAPTSGAETRRKLGGAARRLRERAKDKLHDMQHDAEDAVEAGRGALRQTRDTLNAGGTKPGSRSGS